MSKKQELTRVAVQMGISFPYLEYIRHLNAYSIGVSVPNGRGGFETPIIGVYKTVGEARERLEADKRTFLKNHPSAKDKVKLFKAVEAEQAKLPALLMTDDVREMAFALLDALINQAVIEVSEQHRDYARAVVDYLNGVGMPMEVKRMYVFEIDCPYCNRHVQIERMGPRPPVTCGDVACELENRRVKSRERKRAERKRKQG